MYEEKLVEISDEVTSVSNYDKGERAFTITKYADGREETVYANGRKRTVRNVKPFDGKEIQFKVEHFHGDGEVEAFIVSDKFGKSLTDLLSDIQCLVPYNHSECIVIGTGLKGESVAQRLSCGTYYPEDSVSFDIEFPSTIHEVSYVDENTLLFGTDDGYCLVNSNDGGETFTQKTEFRPKEEVEELLQNGLGDDKPITF